MLWLEHSGSAVRIQMDALDNRDVLLIKRGGWITRDPLLPGWPGIPGGPSCPYKAKIEEGTD